MRARTLIWSAALGAMAIVFFVAVRAALVLQTESGGAFPPYSTMRADPLGARALYEALSRVPGLTVAQNARALRHLKADGDTAFFILGASETPDSAKDLQKIESFVADGGRLIISYAIRGGSDFFCLSEEDADALANDSENGETVLRRWMERDETPALAPRDEIEKREDVPFGMDLASERWGFRVVAPMDAYEFADTEEIYAEPAPTYEFAEEMPWKSPEYFLPIHAGWRTVFTAGEQARPVMMHRDFGRGEIIVASDSYLFSNEAMENDRQPALLAWVVGDKRHVVFEETTKGLSREPGLMGMMRRYRLHGLIAVAALVALLVAWRGSVPLLPRRTEAQERERALVLLGRDAHAGLAALLRSAAPGVEVLRACVSEWERALGRTSRIAPQHREAAREIVARDLENTSAATAGSELVHRYRSVQILLRERRDAP